MSTRSPITARVGTIRRESMRDESAESSRSTSKGTYRSEERGKTARRYDDRGYELRLGGEQDKKPEENKWDTKKQVLSNTI